MFLLHSNLPLNYQFPQMSGRPKRKRSATRSFSPSLSTKKSTSSKAAAQKKKTKAASATSATASGPASGSANESPAPTESQFVTQEEMQTHMADLFANFLHQIQQNPNFIPTNDNISQDYNSGNQSAVNTNSHSQNTNFIPDDNENLSQGYDSAFQPTLATHDSTQQSYLATSTGLDQVESSFFPESYWQDPIVEPDLEQDLGLSGVQDDSSSELVTKVINIDSHVKDSLRLKIVQGQFIEDLRVLLPPKPGMVVKDDETGYSLSFR